jgi:GTP-binding protein
MIIRSAEFLRSGLRLRDFPRSELPEIAFAGRSNVGKSTLINVLVNRKDLVRTSRHPGQTRTLNFFLINHDLLLVDLPGFGFSRASKEMINRYQEATFGYLKARKNLILVVLLLDIRRLPNQEDRSFCRLARELGLGPLLVLTKTDTVGRGVRAGFWSNIAQALEAEDENPIFFSSRTREGREALWQAIRKKLQGEQQTFKEEV